jgi:hypothetical protein
MIHEEDSYGRRKSIRQASNYYYSVQTILVSALDGGQFALK